MSQRLRGGDGARIVAFSVAFVLVGYLSYRQGGYDDVVRGHAAILVLWIVAVGCAFAVLPRTGMSGLGWAAVALMTGWGIWTAVGLIWTESPEATFNEVGRIAGLLGILMLALAMQGPGSARTVVHGAGGAIAVVAVVSVASRLYPSWFPVSDSITTLPGASRRLSFPLGYWNGLAALMAAGVPLLLAPATAGRTTAGRAAAGCALPIAAVCLVLTLSRGGAVAAAAALGVFVLLTAHRARALAVIGVAAVGTLIVVRLVLSHHDLEVGARTGDVAGHGTSVALVLLLAALAAGAVAALAPRVARGDSGEVGVDGPSDRRRTIRLVTVAAGVMVAALLLAAATGMLSSAWNSFQRPSIQGAAAFDASRLGSATGTGRYQFWGAALDAFGTHPFRGIGAGSYEFWWSRNAPFYLPVRNAHSLYLESLAELGVFGLVAVGVLLPERGGRRPAPHWGGGGWGGRGGQAGRGRGPAILGLRAGGAGTHRRRGALPRRARTAALPRAPATRVACAPSLPQAPAHALVVRPRPSLLPWPLTLGRRRRVQAQGCTSEGAQRDAAGDVDGDAGGRLRVERQRRRPAQLEAQPDTLGVRGRGRPQHRGRVSHRAERRLSQRR